MAERAKTLARIDQINGIGLAKARQAARTAFPSVAVLSLYLDLHGYFAVHPPIITAIFDSAINFFHPALRR